MRLTEYEINAIKNSAVKFFGSDSNVYIFGSKIDDSKKGGDIDIFIETNQSVDNFKAKIKFLVELERKIGERKIDVIIKNRNSNENLPIYEIAKQQGVLLQ